MSRTPVTIRQYEQADATALLELFRETVRQVNCRDYSSKQISAWASEAIDLNEWTQEFEGRFVLIAEADNQPVGFIELEDDGHIDRMYVAANYNRLGIGSRLLERVTQEAVRRDIRRLFTEASITARPFFERHGFTVITSQTVYCRGEEFLNYQMERVLSFSNCS